MADKMVELAKKQPGFLGVESARNEVGITVSYWKSLEAIQMWKANMDHKEAHRITSYNVCYTKLLRPGSSSPAPFQPAPSKNETLQTPPHSFASDL